MSNLKDLQALSKNYSILCVEDNEALRTNAEKLLHKFFHIVTTASNGEDALEKFKKQKYPIVLTDIKMPKMDGIALTKEIKKIAPQTHVIVMSAYDDKEYLLKLIEYGVFKFLKKPVTLANITDILYATVLKVKEESSTESTQEKEIKEDTKTITVEEEKDKDLDNVTLLFSILRDLKEKDAKIELHNYYKGLSITNDAEILEVTKNTVLIKTSFTQQKAVQHTSKTTLVSELLPYVVECNEVNQVSFGKHIIELKHLNFTKTSPIDRKTMRLYPEGGYTISLYIKEIKVLQEIRIEDISLSSVRVSMASLPAGLRTSKELRIEINLENDMVVIDTEVTIFRLDEEEEEERFHMVLLFETAQKANFMKYITKRQMAIIREFKGMQNG